MCWNSWIAPHNLEGFFLSMGDLLVKSGDAETAKKLYANAKLSPAYGSWQFRDVLEERLRRADNNVQVFRAPETDPRDGMMIGTHFSCVACHQQ